MIRALNFMNKAPLVLAANTFIGGVSASIGTAALLATKLGISVGNISNFTVVGSDIKCRITGSYGIPYAAFADNLNLTYYQDKSDLVTALGGDCFVRTTKINSFEFKSAVNIYIGAIARSNAKRIVLNNAITIGVNSFVSNPVVDVIYIPRVTDLGGSALTNGCFNASFIKYIYANPYLSTNNAGGVDGDLTDAISRGAIVRYVTNFTAPNAIINLSIGTVYATALQLNFTPPTGSTNAIEFYDCYVNGVYKDTISESGQYVRGLTPNTSYTIEVKPVDIFYNKSTSNIVLQTTALTLQLFDKAISVYNLSNGLELKNGYNGTVGSAVTFGVGKNGNGANFIENNANSKITIPYNNAFTFNDGANDKPFSVSCWVKFTSVGDHFIYQKGAINRLYEMSWENNSLIFRLSSNGNISNRIEVTANSTPVVNTWYHIISTYSGNKLNTGMNLYINGILQTVTRSNIGTTYLGLSTAVEPIYIGKIEAYNTYNFKGTMDELYFFNTELTQAEATSLQTNYLT